MLFRSHCLLIGNKVKASSKGNISYMEQSEFSISNHGDEVSHSKGILSTSNPVKASTFLYSATNNLMDKVYGGRLPGFDFKCISNINMEILTIDHSASNYDELLRLALNGGTVCKDKWKTDISYYARTLNIYINPHDH